MAHELNQQLKRALFKGRPLVQLAVGTVLFALSVALARNVQLEGLWFGLLGGVLIGPVMHYLLGKLLIPLLLGRVWCGWACWTAALLDQLPYRQSPQHLGTRWGRLRYVHFAASLALVLLLWHTVGYTGGALGAGAVAWFLGENLLYWASGAFLAIGYHDNRAFCKYLCPNTVILKQTSRLSLIKVSGEAAACSVCDSQSCLPMCPMDIRIPDYIVEGRRILSTECIQCQVCVAVCSPSTLKPTVGFDLGGLELLQEQPFIESWRQRRRGTKGRPPAAR
jgi:polyferredoxin